MAWQVGFCSLLWFNWQVGFCSLLWLGKLVSAVCYGLESRCSLLWLGKSVSAVCYGLANRFLEFVRAWQVGF